jgi:hypothetical protein
VYGREYLSPEADVRGLVVGTDAENDRAALLEDVVGVLEPQRFLGATGRIVFRIEKEDDRLATEVRQADGLAAL